MTSDERLNIIQGEVNDILAKYGVNEALGEMQALSLSFDLSGLVLQQQRNILTEVTGG